MNVTIQTAITNKTDVCPAVIAGIADFADKAVRKTQFPELKKKTVSLNMYRIPVSVSAAEFVPDFAPAEFGKWKIIIKLKIDEFLIYFLEK